MFNRKNTYAQNKLNRDSIIYPSVTGRIKLTPADFSSLDEFQKWKEFSDKDYAERAKAGRSFDDCLSLDLFGDSIGNGSIEEILFGESETDKTKTAEQRAELLSKFKGALTAKQYRRLYAYYVENMNQSEIAEREGVGQRRVSASITAGEKIIHKLFTISNLETGAKKG